MKREKDLDGSGEAPTPSAARSEGTYYNEWEPFAAQWLRNLMAAGHIPKGVVDERSIKDVEPETIPSRAHFFAGIAGWEIALQLAGWPSDRPVWTGSCPCQPFSVAGRRLGNEDERHLWPDFLRLIAFAHPPTIFGEQVASADGRLWLSGVRADLEALGYSVGAADLCAAGVGAPHPRQRLYWVAHAKSARLEGWSNRGERVETQPNGLFPAGSSEHAPDWMGHAESQQMGIPGLPWRQSEAVECSDGFRRVEPGTFPMAPRIPAHMGLVRAYGNAIVPQVAAEFVAAFLEAFGLGEPKANRPDSSFDPSPRTTPGTP
jgi:DNA (cytosine-5)-methyltransferase 1